MVEYELDSSMPRGDVEKAISSAKSVILERNLNENDYKATVDFENNLIIVTFIDKNIPNNRSYRGNPSIKPGFEVQVEPANFRVVKANLIR